MDFSVGIKVRARGLLWDVIAAEPCGRQTRLRLRCCAGDLRGLEWEILHPHEQVKIETDEPRPEHPGTLDAWRLYHIACLLDQEPGTGAFLAADPGRVTVEPYQLVPLLRALELPRPRLLLADGVGLGKTIQASLIATELIARGRAHRIIVVAPPGPLLAQWDQELRQRFALRFQTIADTAALQAQRRRLELGDNPFNAVPLCLTSLDFAKQERVLGDLERAAWDLAIIDEAHHCVAGAETGDRDDTQRRRLAEVLARRSDGLLLLTATPHDGNDSHFASLIALLDPSLVDGRGGLAGSAYRRHVIRRLKTHVRHPITGQSLFRPRKVVPVPVDAGRPDQDSVRAFHRGLSALVAPRLRRAAADRHLADALAFVSLLKRSVSTIHACVETLRVVADRYHGLSEDSGDADGPRKERARALRAYRRRVLRYGLLDAPDEAEAASLEADGMAADLRLTGGEAAREIESLIGMGVRAAAHDPKLEALETEIRLIRASEQDANIIVYTEYADSQDAALHRLRNARGVGGQVEAISGRDNEQARARTADRFARESGMILVSTDSLAEGLNLHQRCCHLIHLDLPYNPNRLEQRNGRIDRYGQSRTPEIRYLYLAGTFEERLLLRLIAKYEKARTCLGSMPDTLGVTAAPDASAAAMARGFAEEPARLFSDEPSPIRTLDTAAQEGDADSWRALQREIDRAYDGFDAMAVRHGWMAGQGLSAEAATLAAVGAAREQARILGGNLDLCAFVAAITVMAEGAAITATAEGAAEVPQVQAPRDADAAIAGNERIAHGATSGSEAAPPRVTVLPNSISARLDGLPGYDPATRCIRITGDPGLVHDDQGNSVGYLGHAHPMVRRAVGWMRSRSWTTGDIDTDVRVSAAFARRDRTPSVLMTFTTELHSRRRVEFRRLIAVKLPRRGRPVVMPEAGDWLSLAAPSNAVDTDGLWARWFHDWAPCRRPEGVDAARRAMEQLARTFTQHHETQAAQAAASLRQRLAQRAAALCGPPAPPMGDLFGAQPTGPVWRHIADPLDRLAAYAADTDIPAARRQEAGWAVAAFSERMRDHAAHATVSPAVLRPVGMLLLVPAGSAP